MARSVEEFVDMMLQMLPAGLAWPKTRDSEMAQRFWAAAQEFHAIEVRNEQLLKEMSVFTCDELFDEKESELGLPGDCIKLPQSLTERRNAMIAKYKLVGEQSRQMFIDAAADIGFVITITEYDSSNPGPQTEYQGVAIAGDDWNFVWQINVDVDDGVLLTVGSPVGSALQTFDQELLECTMRAIAHDHRALFFNYI